jgi:hypothetical protein
MTAHTAITLALTLALTSAASAGGARTDRNGTTPRSKPSAISTCSNTRWFWNGTAWANVGNIQGPAGCYQAHPAGRVTGKAQPRR